MQIDFVRLFNDYNIPVNQNTNGWIQVECPICKHSGTRGFKGGFNIENGFYNCWICGGTNVKKVLKELLGVEYYQLDKILESYSGISTIRKTKKNLNLPDDVFLPCNYLDERSKKYLIKRNYNPDYIEEKYKIVGIPFDGEFSGRIIIPVFLNGKLVTYQGRSLLSKKRCNELKILRYKTLDKKYSVVNPKHIFYNMDNCKSKFAIVVEGAFDVWRIGDDCLATLGTSTTPEQRMLLCKKFEEVFILFDPEKEAQERAVKLGKQLSALGIKKVMVVDTELNHDPGDMNKKEVLKLKKELGI